MNLLNSQFTIRAAKWMDEYIGGAIINVLKFFVKLKTATDLKVNKILFIKFWGLGSIILSTPALDLIKKRFPGAQLHFLTLDQNRDLFLLIENVDKVFLLELSNPFKIMFNIFKTINSIKKENYDLIFDAEFFTHFSAIVGRLAGAKLLTGFSRDGSIKEKILDKSVKFNQDGHASHNFFRLVETCVKPSESYKPSHPSIKLQSIVSNKKSEAERPYIVININASPIALERRWPAQYFLVLAKALLKKYDVDLIFIGNGDEYEYTEKVINQLEDFGSVKNLAGKTTLYATARIMKNARLVISNDSGPIHLAAALNKPIVGFYGPETPVRYGPLCDLKLVFYLGLKCSPCMSIENSKTVNCTNNRHCMLDQTPEIVIKRLDVFIDQNKLLHKREGQLSQIITQ